jgi:hypothetical protein
MPNTCSHLAVTTGASHEPRPYPSHRHRCTARNRCQVIAPKSQAFFCLTAQHAQCPYFAPFDELLGQPQLPLSDPAALPALT